MCAPGPLATQCRAQTPDAKSPLETEPVAVSAREGPSDSPQAHKPHRHLQQAPGWRSPFWEPVLHGGAATRVCGHGPRALQFKRSCATSQHGMPGVRARVQLRGHSATGTWQHRSHKNQMAKGSSVRGQCILAYVSGMSRSRVKG